MSIGYFEWRVYWPRANAYTTGIGSQEEAERLLDHDDATFGVIQTRKVSPWIDVASSLTPAASRDSQATEETA